jgi:transcriptional regulator with XRE-family HTH domain
MKKTIGDLIRLKRLEKRYTLDMTAKNVGVSLNYISRLEKGDNSNPSDDVIVKLASTLDLDEDFLFNAFDKIPLSTRTALQKHPALSKAISQLASDDSLSEEQQNEYLQKALYWYKKLADDE